VGVGHSQLLVIVTQVSEFVEDSDMLENSHGIGSESDVHTAVVLCFISLVNGT
jgi:hypothetical protein